jgi:hypothetical protein
MKQLLLLLFLIQFINCNNDDIDSTSSSSTTTSYDSLISSQCKARCLSLYPWKLPNNTIDRRNRDMQSSSYNSRRYQRVCLKLLFLIRLRNRLSLIFNYLFFSITITYHLNLMAIIIIMLNGIK